MKTVIIIMLLIGTIFPQIMSITKAPPLNKTFDEVIRIEKIDTAKAIYKSGVIVCYGKTDGDSAIFSYFFTLENKLSSKNIGLPLPNHTGKAALKKYRAITQKLTAVHGKPVYSELMQDLTETDQDKIFNLSAGASIITTFETDTFYIILYMAVEEDSKIMRINVKYLSPDEWARVFVK